jgi:DNA-binding SARP family transcriptional activator
LEAEHVQLRILGPLEVREDGRTLELGGPKPRALLAVLLVHTGEVVSADRLVDDLWGESAPPSASHLLHVYVSTLRKVVGPRLITRTPGYVVELARDELDAQQFERLVGEGKLALAAGDPGAALDALREGLGLWRGPPLADFVYEPFAQAEISRLTELQLVAREELVEALLALGRTQEALPEVDALVAENPLRERPCSQLMLALYRSGRQVDALDAYADARRRLVEELGIEPSPPLQRLQHAILNQDPGLEDEPGSARPLRRLVSVVVADCADEAVDPEGRLAALAAVGDVLRRHGAAVSPLPGDTVLGAFGIPRAHDDDALRAIRAASAAVEVEPSPRIGVETGEVVVEGSSTTGDALARAARLSQAAQPGEILLGETMHRLVHHAVLADIDATGTRRLVAVLPEAPALPRRFDAPFVGRSRERGMLDAAFADAVASRSARFVLLLGDPGIGKSRLVEEFVQAVSRRATTLVGRCRAYGEGTTFEPLAEIMSEAAGGLGALEIGRLTGATEEGARAARHVAAALDPSGEPPAPQETRSAFRRVFDALAHERPLVLVLEDAQWAGQPLLEVLGHIAGWSRGAPMLIVCAARPELLESTRDWLPPGATTDTVALDPLTATDAGFLARGIAGEESLPAEALARVVETAAGNPLFIEQLVAMLTEEGGRQARLGLPPTLQALLAARLDRLGPGELSVLGRAAVAGTSFSGDSIAALLTEEARPSLLRHLRSLTDRGYIRRESDAYSFRHALLREAAYRMLAKRVRAELHERLGEWLEELALDTDEVIGFHLEQSFRYREELREVDWHARRLANRGSDHLAAAGNRAVARMDMPTAARLLRRAVALLEVHDSRRLRLLPELARALRETGDAAGAREVAAEAVAAAHVADRPDAEGRARIELAYVALMGGAAGAVDDAFDEASRAISLFEGLADHDGLARAFQLRSFAHRLRGEQAARGAALERALEHAVLCENGQLESRIRDHLGALRNSGPMPVEQMVALAGPSLEWARANGDRAHEANALAHGFGRGHAMLGELEQARACIAQARAIVDDLGSVTYVAGVASAAAFVETLAGDHAAAERLLREGVDVVGRFGTRGSWFSMAVREELAQVVYTLGRYDEADELSRESERLAQSDDVQTQVLWRGVRAKVFARRGCAPEAERLAREAVALAAQTELPLVQAGALTDLAEVLELAGRPLEGASQLEDAREIYVRKGDRVSSERTRALADELRARAAFEGAQAPSVA